MKKTKKKITMDDLARMVQKGFLETTADLKIVKEDVGILKSDIAVLKTDVAELKTDVHILKKDVSLLKYDVAELKKEFSKILDGLDKVAKQYADYLEERKTRDAEIERLKRWVEQIAQKVGVDLKD